MAVPAVRGVHDDEEVSHSGDATDHRRHPAARSGCVSDDGAETCRDDRVDRPREHERTREYVCQWMAGEPHGVGLGDTGLVVGPSGDQVRRDRGVHRDVRGAEAVHADDQQHVLPSGVSDPKRGEGPGHEYGEGKPHGQKPEGVVHSDDLQRQGEDHKGCGGERELSADPAHHLAPRLAPRGQQAPVLGGQHLGAYGERHVWLLSHAAIICHIRQTHSIVGRTAVDSAGGGS